MLWDRFQIIDKGIDSFSILIEVNEAGTIGGKVALSDIKQRMFCILVKNTQCPIRYLLKIFAGKAIVISYLLKRGCLFFQHVKGRIENQGLLGCFTDVKNQRDRLTAQGSRVQFSEISEKIMNVESLFFLIELEYFRQLRPSGGALGAEFQTIHSQ